MLAYIYVMYDCRRIITVHQKIFIGFRIYLILFGEKLTCSRRAGDLRYGHSIQSIQVASDTDTAYNQYRWPQIRTQHTINTGGLRYGHSIQSIQVASDTDTAYNQYRWPQIRTQHTINTGGLRYGHSIQSIQVASDTDTAYNQYSLTDWVLVLTSFAVQ